MRRYEIAVGTIDGSNRTFTLPSSLTYKPGTIHPVLNGITIHASHTNGLVEVNSTTILMNEAPLTGDVLVLFFDDGIIGDAFIDVEVTADPTEYSVSYNVSNYQLVYNLNTYKL